MDKFVLFADCSYVKSKLFETKLPPEEGNPIDKFVLTQFPNVLNIVRPNPVRLFHYMNKLLNSFLALKQQIMSDSRICYILQSKR